MRGKACWERRVLITVHGARITSGVIGVECIKTFTVCYTLWCLLYHNHTHLTIQTTVLLDGHSFNHYSRINSFFLALNQPSQSFYSVLSSYTITIGYMYKIAIFISAVSALPCAEHCTAEAFQSSNELSPAGASAGWYDWQTSESDASTAWHPFASSLGNSRHSTRPDFTTSAAGNHQSATGASKVWSDWDGAHGPTFSYSTVSAVHTLWHPSHSEYHHFPSCSGSISYSSSQLQHHLV